MQALADEERHNRVVSWQLGSNWSYSVPSRARGVRERVHTLRGVAPHHTGKTAALSAGKIISQVCMFKFILPVFLSVLQNKACCSVKSTMVF